MFCTCISIRGSSINDEVQEVVKVRVSVGVKIVNRFRTAGGGETIKDIKMFWKRLFRNRMGMVGLAVILVNVLMAVLAPWIATHDPLKVDVGRSAPSFPEFWFGTDDFGRDIFSRVIYGSRISLEISVLSVLVATLLGVIIGATAGYYGGWADNLLMRFMDAIMSFPAILLAIGIMAERGR